MLNCRHVLHVKIFVGDADRHIQTVGAYFVLKKKEVIAYKLNN